MNNDYPVKKVKRQNNNRMQNIHHMHDNHWEESTSGPWIPDKNQYDEFSPLFQAKLAKAAYEVNKKDFLTKYLPPNFTVDRQLSNQDRTVFVSGVTGKVFVAFRGTNPLNIKDLQADASITLGFEEADERFMVSLFITRMVIDKYGIENVSVTGHSLGGAQAMYVNAKLGVRSFAFNPGFGPGDIVAEYQLATMHRWSTKIGAAARSDVYTTNRKNELVDAISYEIYGSKSVWLYKTNHVHHVHAGHFGAHGMIHFLIEEKEVDNFTDEEDYYSDDGGDPDDY